MIAASCPSCGSPLSFPHGAAPAVICPACRSSVVRTDRDLTTHGTVAPLARDLSPVQVGARGTVDGKDFEVIGVVRKGRDRVRWNEWYLAFGDGTFGWLGEGNGQFQAYSRPPVPVPDAGAVARDGQLEVGAESWTVVEAAEAEVLAADGHLPVPFTQGERGRYADLRQNGGRLVGTLDFVDTPPVLWVGRIVELASLQMTGLRPFVGWSDPALTGFAGPEIEAVRALRCPNCGAPIALRAPGLTVRLACESCDALLDRTDDGDEMRLVEQVARFSWAPHLPLGSRGRLGGFDWQVIGAMRRYVTEDGEEWNWTEYLLQNPYRGFVWLVEDGGGHWSLVKLLPDVAQVEGRSALHRGRAYTLFQTGVARVRHVLGEFTWEVRAGDSARTADFVAPPTMLSREQTAEEVTWSLGEWTPAGEVAAAFSVELATPTGVAPHQPNPYRAGQGLTGFLTRTGFLVAAAVGVLALAVALPARTPVASLDIPIEAKESPFVGAPFELPAGGRSAVAVTTQDTLGGHPDVSLSLINLTTGEVHDWTFEAGGGRTATFRTSPGTWVVRTEVRSELDPGDAGKTLHLSVVRDPGIVPWAALGLLFCALAPLAWVADGFAFEQRRWQASGVNG